MAGPLEGLHVVEIGDLGEVAGKLLADAGADLVRVEPPGSGARSRRTGPFVGDRRDAAASLHYAYLNTNKRGVTLDLAHPEAADLWHRLVGWTDVVLDSVGPGALDALGVGYQSFEERDGYEQLVWCSITPFGLTGPWRDFASNDLVQMALGGPPMSSGYDDHELPPIRPDGEHSLAMAGEYAVCGILAALWQRDHGGTGQAVDISVHESVAGTTEGAFQRWEYMRENPQRVTGRHANTVERWQFRCADGQYAVLFGGGVPREKQSLEQLLAWMDEYDAAADLHDPTYEAVIYTPPQLGGELRRHFAETVGRFIESRPLEEVYRRGQAMGMPWGPVRRPEDNLDDPHWGDRAFWVEGELPGYDGTVRYPRAGYRFTKSPVEFRRRAPLLGEHNTEIYAGLLGVEPSALTEMAKAGAI
jgi:benzylsuccinate CoA-transferase BbsE subunit